MHNRIILNLLKTVSHTAKHYALKIVYSTTSEFDRNRDIITKKFKEWGYSENLVHEQVDKVKNMKTKQLLLTNKRPIQSRIPVLITYNRYLPNIPKTITKNWNVLNISPTLQKVLEIGTYHLLFRKYLARDQWWHIKETKILLSL